MTAAYAQRLTEGFVFAQTGAGTFVSLEVLMESSGRALAERLTVERADAGMRTIGWLTHAGSDRPAAESARALGLEVSPLSDFAEDISLRPALALGFAGVPLAEIRRGVDVLARALSARPR